MIGVVLVFRDVAEQRRAENELRASEARKSASVETALDCVITMDHHGKVVEFNPHWVGADGIILRANLAELDMLGYSREEFVGCPISDFHADEDVICDILHRLQTGENLKDYPARLRCRTGRSRKC